MRSFGLLLVALAIGSTVVHFMNMEMKLLMWIDTWGEGAAWGIRGGLLVLGLLLAKAGGSKPKGD
ncbi:MAG: hypothetical protein KDC98_10245 [Planctomycetes bacterium]|nr:hypothetical protein [Planctomycetota bacterium]